MTFSYLVVCLFGLTVGVGDVTEAVGFGCLSCPFAQGEYILHAVGYREYMDDESHVWYAEIAVGAFPKTILDVVAVADESGGCSDTVPIEHQLVVGCTIVLFHVHAEVIEEGLDALLSICRDGEVFHFFHFLLGVF